MKLLQWEQYSAFSVIWVLLLFYLLYMRGLFEKYQNISSQTIKYYLKEKFLISNNSKGLFPSIFLYSYWKNLHFLILP